MHRSNGGAQASLPKTTMPTLLTFIAHTKAVAKRVALKIESTVCRMPNAETSWRTSRTTISCVLTAHTHTPVHQPQRCYRHLSDLLLVLLLFVHFPYCFNWCKCVSSVHSRLSRGINWGVRCMPCIPSPPSHQQQPLRKLLNFVYCICVNEPRTCA